MLISGQITKDLYTFMKSQNNNVITDTDKAFKDFSDEIEKVVFEAIKSATITIPPGSIIVQTSTGPGTNLQPIVLSLSLS